MMSCVLLLKGSGCVTACCVGLFDSVNLVLVRSWARRTTRVALADGCRDACVGWGYKGSPWRRLRESLSDPVSLVPCKGW